MLKEGTPEDKCFQSFMLVDLACCEYGLFLVNVLMLLRYYDYHHLFHTSILDLVWLLLVAVEACFTLPEWIWLGVWAVRSGLCVPASVSARRVWPHYEP